MTALPPFAKRMPHPKLVVLLPVVLLHEAVAIHAGEAQVRLRMDGTNALIQVQGDERDDGHVQTSGDFVTSSNTTMLGTIMSGGTGAPSRSVWGTPLRSDSIAPSRPPACLTRPC